MFHRVLVSLDSTPLSAKVLAAALRVADPDGEVIALRIQAEATPLTNSAAVRTELDIIDAETHEVLRRATAAAAALGQTASVRAEVRSGPVEGTILEAATDLEVDLIVMGTHGRKGLTEQVTGSVTERVAARAAASVFVVKAAGYPFLQD
ncbi:MAG: universal stress protein [Myxococcota bacterium]